MLRLTLVALATLPTVAHSQSFRSDDQVIRRMWRLGMDSSHTERLAQVLMDSIGPRLSGTPGFEAASAWLERTYNGLGITVRRERYGTWRGWRAGDFHMTLTAPRTQVLDVELLSWSVGTNNRPIDAEVVIIPQLADEAAVRQWLGTIRGKFVLSSAAELMCRAPQELQRLARAATVTRLNQRRTENVTQASARLRALAPPNTPQPQGFRAAYSRLDSAGVAGIGSLNWSNGWGVNKVFAAQSERVPSFDISCEDYGLLHRLATNNQGPRIRFTADAQSTPQEVPMFNVVAELKGTERPNEYVMLSAHLDSWGAATGATDNGTGTIMMLEAMRILKAAYPNPKRTILVGHWGGEELGLIGSLAFGEDHPDIVAGLQALFNQDNGTWRVEYLEASGFAKAGVNLSKWWAQLPGDLTDSVKFVVPGGQINMGSDHTAFICRSAPAFRFQSHYDEYRQYTWHTNRDTYDKIVFDDLKQNATIAAMMMYAASEDPEKTPRDQATLPALPNGQPRSWVQCGRARRSFAQPTQ
ncbi:MAG: M28 family peptidase [Gemmatimonadaceae bacterium]